MSRLQVGGLALIVGYNKNPNNLGKVVVLNKFCDEIQITRTGEIVTNRWLVSADNLVDDHGESVLFLASSSHNLMPLGDKKTQDELKKELETI